MTTPQVMGLVGLVLAVVASGILLGRHLPAWVVGYYRWAMRQNRACDLDGCGRPRRSGDHFCSDAHDREDDLARQRRGYYAPASEAAEESWLVGGVLLAIAVGGAVVTVIAVAAR